MREVTSNNTKILFIDDEVRIVEVYKTMLEEKGFEVDATTGADDALRLVTENDYDIVFCDQFIGCVRGLELMRTLGSIKPGLSFVIISGNGSEDLAVESLKCGADDFIMKPFLLSDLIRSIDYVKKKSQSFP